MDIGNGYGNAMGFAQAPFQQSMPYSNPYMSSRTQNNKINWIQGEEEARAYQLVPNSNIALIDGNKNILYLKSCDSMGMCTLRAFDVVEREENNAVSVPEPDMSAYVRREEFEELKQLINNIGGGLNEKSVSADDGQSGKRSNNGNGGKN